MTASTLMLAALVQPSFATEHRAPAPEVLSQRVVQTQARHARVRHERTARARPEPVSPLAALLSGLTAQAPAAPAIEPGVRTPRAAQQPATGAYAAMVARHAAANGIPAALVHRTIMRESRYNARAISKGNYGIMQIRLATARAMGYTGTASGLLDADTNMTYAVRYLAGAYRAAGGNPNGAIANYARGYRAARQVASPSAPERPAVAPQTRLTALINARPDDMQSPR